MTDDSKTSTRNFIRGGQVLLHNFRMVKQLLDRTLVFTLIVFLSVTIGLTYYRTNGWHSFAVKHWCAAHIFTFFYGSNAKQKMRLPGAYSNAFEERMVLSSEVLRDPQIVKAVEEVGSLLILSTLYGAISSIGTLFLVVVYFRKRGKKQSETKQLRGYEIAEKDSIKKLIKKDNRSDITIGGLCLPKSFETGHVLIHGTTGMGKSVCIKELLDQIRKRGDKVIIYDQGCDYISSFYTKEDIILNPLDERTASWCLWDECRDSADYDSLAAALIPSPPNAGEPFWSNGARVIFSAMAQKIKETIDQPKIPQLLASILSADLRKMEKVLQNTEAAPLVSERADKTSLSFKSMLATYLRSLKYIKEEENPFSIRKWIQDDNQKNWLFISSLADRHETLKPLISMWLDIAANSLLSLAPSYTRRIWLFFDELASLHKLPYLPNAFAQSRKFGGCLVAGVQSIAQLRKVYGQHAADEISTMCNTRIFFRSPSNEAAVWTSKELGQHEIEEMQEGISYSESAMRSGISINKHTIQKDLVNAAEIMQLQPLEAYVRLPGNLPITKIKLSYKDRTSDAQPFIARNIAEKTYKEVTDKISLASEESKANEINLKQEKVLESEEISVLNC